MSPRPPFADRASWLRRQGAAPVGALRRRLLLQRPEATEDGSGGQTVIWTDVASLWAAVTPLSGSFSRWADGPAGELWLRVELRHREDIRPGMRFLTPEGERLFIEAAHDPDGTRRRLVCRCHVQPA